ncbi:MAG TPA: RsmF rRNA methyltransferase first C-terminal domain-containing protein, partial [Flavisolibacter sp.]|nr:RsmF rRNA methyltransferase first C-terminal domain-containing protein [Flavisolibacter sp.]
RFYPDKVKGEGFFLACFQKTEPENERRFKEGINEKINAKEKDILKDWCTLDDRLLIKEQSSFFLMPQSVSIAYLTLHKYLHIMYKGIYLGEIMNNKLIPSHSLALSMKVSEKIPVEELDYTMAIEYLQKKPLQISEAKQGWNIARYHKRNLGWMNVLPNRINNYYPKGLRILKQSAH